jgi:hypothetical protein
MRLSHTNPRAGRVFHVIATDCVGTARLRLYIDDQVVAEMGCPDPPCHEMCALPAESQGRRLRVLAEDDSGPAADLRLIIGPPLK